jgi:hypothetical protein
LKKAILHRKNSLFYWPAHGALIGDLFMSLVHTCNLGGIDPFCYLVALQKLSRRLQEPSKLDAMELPENPASQRSTMSFPGKKS